MHRVLIDPPNSFFLCLASTSGVVRVSPPLQMCLFMQLFWCWSLSVGEHFHVVIFLAAELKSCSSCCLLCAPIDNTDVPR